MQLALSVQRGPGHVVLACAHKVEVECTISRHSAVVVAVRGAIPRASWSGMPAPSAIGSKESGSYVVHLQNTEWPNTLHSANTTNLHVHGLHVSPKSPQDNTMIEIQSRDSYNYRFEIPKDHPAGTYWYVPA